MRVSWAALSESSSRSASLCLITVWAFGLATAASAERVDELDRWVPSVSIFSGVMGQSADGSIVTGIQAGTTEPLRPPVDDGDVVWNPFVGGSLELMTPGWRELPGKPRLFVHGGIDGAFGFNRNIAKEGSPGELAFPLLPPDSDRCDLDERQVSDQGSSIRARGRSPVITAGGGVAFSLLWGERLVRIKPSFEYLRIEYKLDAKARDASVVFDCFPSDPPQTFFRFVSLDDQDELVVDGIGAGLALEADAGRAGPLLLSLYLSGQAYRVLGDRDVTLTSTFTDALGTETASWDFELDEWFYRGGVGLRFRFVPESADWWESTDWWPFD